MAIVRFGTAQFFSGPDTAANLQMCINWMRRAADAGVQLLVMPENSNRVRDFTTREAAWELSEDLDGDFVTGLRAACAELGLWLAVGVDLRGEDCPDVFIGQVLINDAGEIAAVHRKHIFWDYEYTLFTPGTEPITAVETPLGRLGLLMCADGIVPEVPRLLGLDGAQVFLNSLNSRGPDEHRLHVPQRAMENRVWHVSSNTVGGPADAYPWMGGSQIVSPDGVVLAAAGESEEELVWADLDPAAADQKTDPLRGDVFAARRPDLYGDLALPVQELPVAAMYGPAGETPSTLITVAPLQVSWFHNRDWTVTRALGQIEYAGSRAIALGVLPELFCFRPGEVAADPADAAAFSAEVLDRIRAAATAARMHVAVNLVEDGGGAYFNTTWLVGPDGGTSARYRKTHLEPAEGWATPGDDLTVAQTALGRIGFMTGSEVWFPEVARVLTVRGAELIVHPTGWDRPEAATCAAVQRTEENRVHLISSARLDSAGSVGSQVVEADEFVPGQPIALMRYPTAWTCRGGFEEQMKVELDLRGSHSKVQGFHLDPVATRQPFLYQPFVRAQEVAAR
ncbi:nitrilase-related carbon-nitrogen hydrolase [Arthrobacter sp. 7Tela_A1]|uniref:nitrilase-related carbon-nitrogen hydrolase n=1 Tax=Arthrobacter sp. 7Tela_A1 TaxID=3093745 RepID=UPI003BB4C1C1